MTASRITDHRAVHATGEAGSPESDAREVPEGTRLPGHRAPAPSSASDPKLPLVAAVIAEITGLPESVVVPEADLIEDLYIDSVAKIELMVACEDRFGVEIPDEVVSSLHTVGSVLDYLAARSAS